MLAKRDDITEKADQKACHKTEIHRKAIGRNTCIQTNRNTYTHTRTHAHACIIPHAYKHAHAMYTGIGADIHIQPCPRVTAWLYLHNP